MKTTIGGSLIATSDPGTARNRMDGRQWTGHPSAGVGHGSLKALPADGRMPSITEERVPGFFVIDYWPIKHPGA
mgnify:CR=1 FL=1